MGYTLTEELPLKTLIKLLHFQGPHISAFVELLKVCPELNQGGGYIKKLAIYTNYSAPTNNLQTHYLFNSCTQCGN